MEPGSLGSPGLPAAVSLGYQAFGRLPGRRRAREASFFRRRQGMYAKNGLRPERRGDRAVATESGWDGPAEGGTMSYLREVSLGEKEFRPLALIEKDYGFIPNFFRAQTMRPDLLDAEVQLIDAILIKEGALTRRQKEYIFLVCSAANLSTYCVTAHCEIVRMLGIEGPEPEQIAVDHTVTDLPVIDKALLNFALKLNSQPTKVKRRDIDALRTYGFSDEQILEAVVMVGLAKFANFIAFGLGTVPDFHAKIALHPSEAGKH